MNAKVFLDTNVLVYAYDSRVPEKQRRAQSLLEDAVRGEHAVLSAQVLGEFFTVVTRRIPVPLTADEAQKVVEAVGTLRVVEIDRALVNRAIDAHRRYQTTYWDGLIVAAAERSGCEKILSEDLADGAQYFNVLVENPFV